MASVEKICALFGDEIISNGETLYTFLSSEKIAVADEELLKTCSLGYRLPYIKDAATRVCDGRLNLINIDSLSDDDLFEKLKEVHGVVDKVSNCICLFGYVRVSMAPVDTWIKRSSTNSTAESTPSQGTEKPPASCSSTCFIMQGFNV